MLSHVHIHHCNHVCIYLSAYPYGYIWAHPDVSDSAPEPEFTHLPSLFTCNFPLWKWKIGLPLSTIHLHIVRPPDTCEGVSELLTHTSKRNKFTTRIWCLCTVPFVFKNYFPTSVKTSFSKVTWVRSIFLLLLQWDSDWCVLGDSLTLGTMWVCGLGRWWNFGMICMCGQLFPVCVPMGQPLSTTHKGGSLPVATRAGAPISSQTSHQSWCSLQGWTSPSFLRAL